jgi:hypothetical protein
MKPNLQSAENDLRPRHRLPTAIFRNRLMHARFPSSHEYDATTPRPEHPACLCKHLRFQPLRPRVSFPKRQVDHHRIHAAARKWQTRRVRLQKAYLPQRSVVQIGGACSELIGVGVGAKAEGGGAGESSLDKTATFAHHGI